MIKPFLVVVLSLLAIGTAIASNEFYTIGARAKGMGGSSVAMQGVFSTHNNQAGLAAFEHMAGGIYSEKRFFLNALNLHAGAVVVPTANGVFGLGISYFGYKAYNDKKIGLAFGKKFSDRFSGGVQLDYLSTFISEFGNRSAFTAEAGIQARISRTFLLGAHLFNPFRIKVSEFENEKVPTTLRVGLIYTPSDKLLFTVETEKDIDLKPVVRAGMEYLIVKKLFIRTGLSTNPVVNSFGIGLNLDQLKMDIATSIHPVLGISPHFSLLYLLHKEKAANE